MDGSGGGIGGDDDIGDGDGDDFGDEIEDGDGIGDSHDIADDCGSRYSFLSPLIEPLRHSVLTRAIRTVCARRWPLWTPGDTPGVYADLLLSL